jgi:hypothetical protein
MLVLLHTLWNGMWWYTDERLNSRTVHCIYNCITFNGHQFVCMLFVSHLRNRHYCKKLLILWISNNITFHDNITFCCCLGNVFVTNTKRFRSIFHWIYVNRFRIFHVFWNKEITAHSPTEIVKQHPLYDFRHYFITFGRSYLYAVLMRLW